jgi:hypothetical protein
MNRRAEVGELLQDEGERGVKTGKTNKRDEIEYIFPVTSYVITRCKLPST